MSKLDSAKKNLKIMGIVCIVFGVIGIIMGAMTIGGGVLIGSDQISAGVSSAEEADAVATTLGVMTFAGIIFIVSSLFTLLLGVFSVRGANDTSKIGPAYILSIIDLVLSALATVLSLMNGFNLSNLLDGLSGVVLAVAIFMAANTIKKEA